MNVVQAMLVLLVIALAGCGDDRRERQFANQRMNAARWKVSLEQIQAAEALRVPPTVEHELSGIEFVLVPGSGEVDPFYLSRTEVTNEQFKRFEPHHAGAFRDDEQPVDMVASERATRFAAWLGEGYRLPTEKEWEHACRAGSKTAFAFGETLTRAQANIGDGGPVAPGVANRSQAVGSYKPNRWGLYDMHGNLREWCVPPTGVPAVSRGGSWRHPPSMAMSNAREEITVGNMRDPDTGFRVLRTLLGPPK